MNRALKCNHFSYINEVLSKGSGFKTLANFTIFEGYYVSIERLSIEWLLFIAPNLGIFLYLSWK